MPGGETTQLDSSHTATVSSFRLDKYEVTVGRFRAFVDAWVSGWRPAAGSGKHPHLNGGLGLSNSNGAGHEPGWDGAWNTQLPTTWATWDVALACGAPYNTWTPTAGSNETLPQNCLTWYELHAFCLWDGAFLPSEAEWQYASAGGAENRQYAWGSTDPRANAALAVYGCYWNGTGSCAGLSNIAPVGSVPAGNGRWGQSDLAGSLWEWTLDWNKSPYPIASCRDCANVTAASIRSSRGGSFGSLASSLTSRFRGNYAPTYRGYNHGGRCARSAP